MLSCCVLRCAVRVVDRRVHPLCARRAVAGVAHAGPGAHHRAAAGDPTQGAVLRPHVERPGRRRVLGHLAARRRMAFRCQGHS